MAVGALPDVVIAGCVRAMAGKAVRRPISGVVKGSWQPSAGGVAIGALSNEMVPGGIRAVAGQAVCGIHKTVIESHVGPVGRIMTIRT